MTTLQKIKKEIKTKANPKKAKLLQRFFKTGKGEYGEGDIFLGLVVPESRKVVKKYADVVGLKDVALLLHSKIHEERSIALLIFVQKFQKSDDKQKKDIFDIYLKNTEYINNWDLVDLSAHKIIGEYLKDKPRAILYKLAKSKSLWEKRISVISTFAFINTGDYKDSLKIAKILLNDEHDLIHKAVGWMLREIGKKDMKTEEDFLKKHYKKMPRTMLRYAIEKFPEEKRKAYLGGLV